MPSQDSFVRGCNAICARSQLGVMQITSHKIFLN